MRVSIVATSLDGETPESKSVISNVHRIHTRNSGYDQETPTNISMPTIPDARSIQGATALKLDEEVREEMTPKKQDELVSGISLENATYFENNLNQDVNQKDKKEDPEEVVIDDISIYEEKPVDIPEVDSAQEDVSPQLFSDESIFDTSSEDNDDNNSLKEEEEFEIPAFLRKQKF